MQMQASGVDEAAPRRDLTSERRLETSGERRPRVQGVYGSRLPSVLQPIWTICGATISRDRG